MEEVSKIVRHLAEKWGELVLLCAIAGVISVVNHGNHQKLTLWRLVWSVFCSVFVGVVAAYGFSELDMGEKTKIAVAVAVSYPAIHVLTGLNRLGKRWSEKPEEFLGKK